MAYTTIAKVRAASGFSDNTKILDATITQRISEADGVIDSYIGAVYTLPLGSTPDIIESISLNITIALLYTNEYGEESEDTDKGWQKKLDFFMEMLEKIRKRKMKLFDPTTGEELTRNSLLSPAFSPNNSNTDSDENGEAPRLTMSQKF